MATVDVSVETLIRRPRSVVAAYAVDPDNATQWYANIVSVRWETAPPLAVGSKFAFVAKFLGRRLAYTYEVVEHTAQRRFVMRTAEGPFPMETSYEFDDAGPDATRMTLRNRGEPAGFSRLVTPMLGMAMRRANTKDLQRLTAILEATPPG